ncbi:Protein ALWAYS EARLY 1 [Cardamine amara subsp. amara]|uniref:Protein ALWAYS EARLY 1 n=1 Tax=Cardamine amara subsp. amara TaxID=228776 RepID=A0ABD0ZVY0_CARAN
MAPSRKSKSVNKRVTNEASPGIGSSSKTKQRKKRLTDKLGPQWTRVELERFYEAYRKHEKDWKKVAAAVRSNRSADMVEALFNMNRAYLSLPEGTASVVGLVAMMTDHYSVMEASESEGEGHDTSGVSRKHQKHKRAKVSSTDFREEVIPPHSIAPAVGCLSFLKQTQAFVRERRATGKRTPRFLVPSDDTHDREDSPPPSKRAKKQLDSSDGDNARVLALSLAEALRRGGELDDTPFRLGKTSQAKEAQSKHHDSSVFENRVRISRDRRHKKRARGRDEAEGNDSDESREAYNANEGLGSKQQKGMVDVEASRDELEALQILEEMAALGHPAGLMESDPESSAQLEEERIVNDVDEECNTPETVPTSHHRVKVKQARPEDRKLKPAQDSVDGNAVSTGELRTSRRLRKPKVLGLEASKDSIQRKSISKKESAEDDNLMALFKARRSSQGPAKQLKTAKTSEESSSISDKKKTEPDAVVSAKQVSDSGPASLPQKPPNRRKRSLKKSLQERAISSETTHEKPHSYKNNSEHELLDESLEEKVSTCLSYPLVRRWCIFEWFYSAIDYPWFAKMEFIDYLNHVGLGHVPRLSRTEWSVIKSSLGRPRRFSARFLDEERDKLQQYRESVRKHYTEVRTGDREALPTDLARPLSVGNRVIAIHPKTREIRDGKVLSVDHNKCKIFFDELGVELVMDIDCMPLNPLEYMPEGLRRQIDQCFSISKEAHLNRQPNSDGSVLLPPSMLENVSFSMNPPEKQNDTNGLSLHGKVLATNTTTDQNIATNSKARGADIQRARMLQYTSDGQEMEPEIIEIVSSSKSMAQAMVDVAVKAASSVKKGEVTKDKVQQALNSIGKHQPLDKHQGHSNGSLDHHHPSNKAEAMNNGFISQDGSGKNEMQMPSELITSCVASWLMIQMCTEKQYPPADVAQLMETAVASLQPRCPQNMPIYREIQTCMGWIKNQIMSLVRT